MSVAEAQCTEEERMEIVMKRLQDLHPYENNPRMNDNAVDAVAESIKQYGFKVPIIVDGGG